MLTNLSFVKCFPALQLSSKVGALIAYVLCISNTLSDAKIVLKQCTKQFSTQNPFNAKSCIHKSVNFTIAHIQKILLKNTGLDILKGRPVTTCLDTLTRRPSPYSSRTVVHHLYCSTFEQEDKFQYTMIWWLNCWMYYRLQRCTY